MSDVVVGFQDESALNSVVTMTETIVIEVEDNPTQFIDIIQEDQQVVVVTEDAPTVIEFASEGLQGPPGTPGAQGPQGPAGPDLNTDLVDLTLIFNNQLV